jgi:hypothetical protein
VRPSHGYGFTRTSIVAAVVAVVIGLVVVAIFVDYIANYHGPRVAMPRESPGPAPTERISQAGEGTAPSAPFELMGVDYDIDWTVTPHVDTGCFQALTLEQINGPYIGGTIVSVSLDGSGPASGTSFLYGVPAGRYYISASSDCAWTVTLIQSD